MSTENFVRDNSLIVILCGYVISTVFVPLTSIIFSKISIDFEYIPDKYQKLKAVGHATLCWTSLGIVGYLIHIYSVIFVNKQTFIDDLSSITRVILMVYLFHTCGLSHRLKVSRSRLLLNIVEACALIWGFYWNRNHPEPGVLFVLINGPSVRSMLWITMYDALSQQQAKSVANNNGTTLDKEDISTLWFGAFGWSLFWLVSSAIFLIIYLSQNKDEIPIISQVVIPILFFIHAVVSLPFYLRLWKKGQEHQAYRIRVDERSIPSDERMTAWLRAVELGETTKVD
eukprot:c4808_g1_i1.p1 GENE.c4808_g1_i1~~c4808_g1_i1.p1  ORF type:complete len:285 (+),score=64.21 c4808_g1_i1:11-865(+)